MQLHYVGPKDVPAADVSLRAIDDQGIDIMLEGTKQVGDDHNQMISPRVHDIMTCDTGHHDM